MTLDSPEDLFEYELHGIYYGERRLADLLDELQTSATDSTLVGGFADHRDETVEHVERLELTGYEGLLALADALNVDDETVDLLERNRKEDEATLDELESVSEGGEFQSFIDRLL